MKASGATTPPPRLNEHYLGDNRLVLGSTRIRFIADRVTRTVQLVRYEAEMTTNRWHNQWRSIAQFTYGYPINRPGRHRKDEDA